MLEHASAILARVRAAQVDLAAIAKARSDAVLRVGSFQNLAALLVTPILPRLRAALSVGSVEFVEHETGRDMQALVRDRVVDVAFTLPADPAARRSPMPTCSTIRTLPSCLRLRSRRDAAAR